MNRLQFVVIVNFKNQFQFDVQLQYFDVWKLVHKTCINDFSKIINYVKYFIISKEPLIKIIKLYFWLTDKKNPREISI